MTIQSELEVKQVRLIKGTGSQIAAARQAGEILDTDLVVQTDAPEPATAEQGALADTAIQPGDNITELTNNANYQTNTQVSTAISTHNTDTSAHNYIQGLVSSEESRAKGVEGTLSSLTTDVKSSLVSAINEVDSHTDTNASDISDIQDLIPNDATSSNKLADKNFVNSSIATNTANFIGTFNSVAELNAYSGTLTNNDYAFVVGQDSAGNTVYYRYKYTDATTPASWVFEYELNNSSFTADQWAAINSLATTTKIAQIATNQNAIGTLSSLTTSVKTDLVSAINEVDSEKVDKNTAITGATKCKITYDSKGLVTGGADLSASDIPSLTLSKISDITATASELNVLDGITASTTELNYTDGVTSNIQTQLNAKIPNTRTINGKALSSNISLTAGDVGALPSSTVIPTVNDATLKIQKNGSDVATFTANQSTNVTANISVPTQASDIGAQPTLVSGTNIKTINSTSLLGSGNVAVQPTLVSGTNIKTVNSQSLLGSGNLSIYSLPTQTGQSGKFLTTNGTSASWATIQQSPDTDGKSITLNSSDELQTIGVINQNNTSTAIKQWSGTKAQYNAIATKDANTIYNITDDTTPSNFANVDLSNLSQTGQAVINGKANTSLSNLDSAGQALFTAKLDADKIQQVLTLPVSPVTGTLYLIPE